MIYRAVRVAQDDFWAVRVVRDGSWAVCVARDDKTEPITTETSTEINAQT